MVCTASDLEGWNDFPKGLRVLLLDEDAGYSAEIRSKLEAMDYIVTAFSSESEALSAFSNTPECFHVAIVEVNTSKDDLGFKFLDTAKAMPIVMTSNILCLNTMMKCIALGAVEFLQKPLCEEKLRNIWQHVVHKAFNVGGEAVSQSIKSVKESVLPMLQPSTDNETPKCNISVVTETAATALEHDHEQSLRSDKYPAPSTQQIKQGSRSLDDVDCHDQTNSSEKESGEYNDEFKSVEITCGVADETFRISEPEMPEKIVVKQENNAAEVSMLVNNSQPHTRDCTNDTGCATDNPSKASGANISYKPSRKKIKVDWTPELHKKFVRAVEVLGVDQAIPSRILELMKTEGLTRHNVASHLQKYRMHKRHILPKNEDRRVLHYSRDPTQLSHYHHKPIMAFPPYHYNSAMPGVYPTWGQPASANMQMWGSSSYPPWKASENWHWKPPYQALRADTWGCPVMLQPPQEGYSPYPQTTSEFLSPNVVENGCSNPIASGLNNANLSEYGCSTAHDSSELHLADEIIDKIMKEAMSKPWLPLPLGLKLPSTEGVLTELSRQGICNIPPLIDGFN